MKYRVNSACIGCGVCEAMCPDVFIMNEQGLAIASEDEVSPALQETAEEALEACPVAAIERLP